MGSAGPTLAAGQMAFQWDMANIYQFNTSAAVGNFPAGYFTQTDTIFGNSTFVGQGSAIQGATSIGQRYNYFYVSGCKVDWTVRQQEVQSPVTFQMALNGLGGIPPVGTTATLATGTCRSYAGGHGYPVGIPTRGATGGSSGGNEAFALNKAINGTVVSKPFNTAESGNSIGRCSQYFRLAKYYRPGFPLSSASFWTDTNNGLISGWVPPTIIEANCNMMLLCSDGSATGQVLRHTLEVTWFITAFIPCAPQGLLYGPLMKVSEVHHESKEEKKESKDDESYDDLSDSLGRATVTTPVHKMLSVSTSSSSSSSLSSLAPVLKRAPSVSLSRLSK